MKTSIRNVALFAVIAGFGSLLSLPLLAQLSQNSSFVGSLLNAPAIAQEAEEDGGIDVEADNAEDIDAEAGVDTDAEYDAGYSEGVRALW